MEHGDPLGEPGAAFAYSDTGYVMLGDIIERATGATLAEASASCSQFDELGLASTWLEDVEAAPDGAPPMASQFYETQDMVDADPSFDLYGGGGLVSTVGDLTTFYGALLAGDVFEEAATLRTMTDVPTVERRRRRGHGAVPLRPPGPRRLLVAQRVLGHVRGGVPGRDDRSLPVPSQSRSTVRRDRARSRESLRPSLDRATHHTGDHPSLAQQVDDDERHEGEQVRREGDRVVVLN